VTRLTQFVLVVLDPPTEGQVERLLDRGDDTCVEWNAVDGEAWVAFDREAPTLMDAIVSGVRDLHHVGLEPIGVREDDDIVSLGVIAQRIGRPESAVRRWAEGDSGPGGFPVPLFDHPRRPCYRWSEVLPWLSVHFGHKGDGAAATLRAVNLALELRSLAPEVERMAALRTLLTS
jgi:hypothetical protein